MWNQYLLLSMESISKKFTFINSRSQDQNVTCQWYEFQNELVADDKKQETHVMTF